MTSKAMVQEDIIDKKVSLTPEKIARYRAAIAKGADSWDSLLDSLEDTRLEQVQGKTETQHVLRFSAEESPDVKVVQEVQGIIDGLPLHIQDRLRTLGAGLAVNLVERYGTAAPSIIRKNCVEREPRDPILQVDIKSGAVVFDHLDEFRDTPWGITQPREGSLMAAMIGVKGYRMPEPVRDEDRERAPAFS